MNLEITVVNNVIQPVKCSLYSHTCAIIESHHICPKSWFVNQPIDTPMAAICPSCHMNTHAAIDGQIKGQDSSLLPPRCRALAAQAFTIAAAKGLTPTLTL